MKIFELRFTKENEKAWMYAETVIDAIKTYCSITGTDLIDLDTTDDIIELPKEKWLDYSVKDDEFDEVPKISFSQWVSENENLGSDIIATTIN